MAAGLRNNVIPIYPLHCPSDHTKGIDRNAIYVRHFQKCATSMIRTARKSAKKVRIIEFRIIVFALVYLLVNTCIFIYIILIF